MVTAKQRFGGLLMVTLSAAGTAWNWQMANKEGYFHEKLSFVGPVFLVIGIGLILFLSYRAERMSRGEDLTSLQGWRIITPRWWAILAVGLIFGFVDWLLISA